jgi:hypothetical protein
VTDRIALWLGSFILVLVAADLFLNGGEALLFLARELFAYVEYLSFWR